MRSQPPSSLGYWFSQRIFSVFMSRHNSLSLPWAIQSLSVAAQPQAPRVPPSWGSSMNLTS
jgi:hypothetical protein